MRSHSPNSLRRNPSSATVRRLLGLTTLALALIPWVNFGLNTLDTQPWTLVSASFYILATPRPKLTVTCQLLIATLLLGVLSVVVVYGISDSFFFARGLYGYLTVSATIYVASDFVKQFGTPKRTFVIVNLLYLFFGLTDLVAPYLSAAISANRTTAGRGVCSLAAEPSFFGLYLFFSSWLHLVAYRYRPPKRIKMLIIVNLVAVTGLAQSALAVVLVGQAACIYAFYRLLASKSLIKSAAVILSLCSALYVTYSLTRIPGMTSSRLSTVLDEVNAGRFQEFLISDASANTRLYWIVSPFAAAGSNLFFPGGFESYGTQSVHNYGTLGDLFANSRETGHVISSWTGAFTYELGIFGLVFILLVLLYGTQWTAARFAERVIFLATLLHAVPINFPIAPLLLTLITNGSQRIADKRPPNTFSDSRFPHHPAIALHPKICTSSSP